MTGKSHERTLNFPLHSGVVYPTSPSLIRMSPVLSIHKVRMTHCHGFPRSYKFLQMIFSLLNLEKVLGKLKQVGDPAGEP